MLYLYDRPIHMKEDLLDVAVENGFEPESLIQEVCSTVCKGTRCETCKYVKRRFQKLDPCIHCRYYSKVKTLTEEDKYEYGDNKAKKMSGARYKVL